MPTRYSDLTAAERRRLAHANATNRKSSPKWNGRAFVWPEDRESCMRIAGKLRSALEDLMADEGGEPRKGDDRSIMVWDWCDVVLKEANKAGVRRVGGA